MQSFGKDLDRATVLRHRGALIALAAKLETEDGGRRMALYYRVLVTSPERPDDDLNWTDESKLIFPDEMRPAGASLNTIPVKAPSVIRGFYFWALSDGKHLFVFRPSSRQTLLVNRFLFDEESKTLAPNWEARFQRSRKKDVPAGRRDSLGFVSMDGKPFVEPTIELPLLTDVGFNCFSVLLAPTQAPSENRWLFFAFEQPIPEEGVEVVGWIHVVSIRRRSNGLFDLTDVRRSRFGLADEKGTGLIFKSRPAALLYLQQEQVLDSDDGSQNVKRGARVMLAVVAGFLGDVSPSAPLAVLEFTVAPDGSLSQLPVDGQINLPDLAFLDDSGLVLPELFVDGRGLAVRGASLVDAQASDTPFLLDSADGLVHLYFRQEGRLMVAQYDTATARARFNLLSSADGQPVSLVAHRAGDELNAAELTIESGDEAGQATVMIESNDGYGTREVWREVPLRLDRFISVMRGDTTADPADEPLVQSGDMEPYDVDARRSFTSRRPAFLRYRLRLDQGAILFKSRRPFPQDQSGPVIHVERAGRTCTVTFGLRGEDGRRHEEVFEDVPVDAATFITHLNGQAASFFDLEDQGAGGQVPEASLSRRLLDSKGSLLFGVESALSRDAASLVDVKPGQVTLSQQGQAARWIPEPLGRALLFEGRDGHLVLPAPSLDLSGDMTLEAWVWPFASVEQGGEYPRLIHYNSVDSHYALALDVVGEQYRLLANAGDQVVRTDRKFPSDRWTHVAAVYHSSAAIRLSGRESVDCGYEEAFNTGQALTVETVITPEMSEDDPGGRQVIASRWGEAHQRSWRLYLDTRRHPCFETRYLSDGKVTSSTVTGSQALTIGQSTHIAAVFEATPWLEGAFKFNGVDNYASIAGLDKFPNEDFTIAFWMNSRPERIAPSPTIFSFSHGIWSGAFRVTVTATQLRAGFYESQFNFPASLVDGRWHHVALAVRLTYLETLFLPVGMSHNRIRAKIQPFIDGEPIDGVTSEYWRIDRGSSPLPALDTSGAITLGHRGSADGTPGSSGSAVYYYNGLLHNLGLWDQGLMTQQVKQEMEKTDPTGYPFRPIGYWPLTKGGENLVQNDAPATMAGALPQPDVFDKGAQMSRYQQSLYVAGLPQGGQQVLKSGDALADTDAALIIGRSAAGEDDHFVGKIEELRLWKAGRTADQVKEHKGRSLKDHRSLSGLVGYWPLEEGAGTLVYNVKTNNPAAIKGLADDKQLERLWQRSSFGARWDLYIDGEEEASTPISFGRIGGPGQEPQFTIGGMVVPTGKVDAIQGYGGLLDEVRIWRRARTAEQIADSLYRRLGGKEDGLAGYWPLDSGQTGPVRDLSGGGNHGQMKASDGSDKPPIWAESDAPISNEGPQVHNVYRGIDRPSSERAMKGSPAVAEYGDMQWDDEGNLFGVMKRCYVFSSGAGADARVRLITDFKVGNLDLQYIGQIQTAPTLIGYIEGAPPVPGENLTGNPDSDDFEGVSSIELTEAGSTVQIYSSSRDEGRNVSIDAKGGLYWDIELEAGVGVSAKTFESEAKIGLHAAVDASFGTLNEAVVATGSARTLTQSLALRGEWIVDERGARYVPKNVGYALVKSGTADLFALRLRGSGALVSYRILPNPDIPEDWNVILFPINAKYVKNGTLDGRLGLAPDKDYLHLLEGEKGSYFRPLEAYALKDRINREREELESYFRRYNVERLGIQGVLNDAATIATAVTSGGDAPSGDGFLRSAGASARENLASPPRMAERSLVNTYVWTADGGFFAEELEFSNARQESLGSSFSGSFQAGAYVDFVLASGAGMFMELDALVGASLDMTVVKSREEESSFGMAVSVDSQGSMKDEQRQDIPGKVDSYRFMTFYLTPANRHFRAFFDKVVDQDWLYGRGIYEGKYIPNAHALRAASSRANAVWRVMHRVTYVSRIPPQFEAGGTAESKAIDVRKPDDPKSNIRLVEAVARAYSQLPQAAEVPLDRADLGALGDAVDKWLETVPDQYWYTLLRNNLYQEAVAEAESSEQAHKLTREREEKFKRSLRNDVMEYLQGVYEINRLTPAIDQGEVKPPGGPIKPVKPAAPQELPTTIKSDSPASHRKGGFGEIELHLEPLKADLGTQVQVKRGDEWQDMTDDQGGRTWNQDELREPKVSHFYYANALGLLLRWKVLQKTGGRPRVLGVSQPFRLEQLGQKIQVRVTLD